VTKTQRRWRQQYDRMKRARHRALLAAPRVDVEVEDDYYAFYVWCFHRKDWLEHDDTVPPAVRAAVEPFVRSSGQLSLCGDLANGVKHLRADRTPRVDPDSRLSAITAAPDTADTGDRIVIVVGREYRNATEVADSCIAAWDGFLRGHGLM
jgi:hypothetical protein